MRAVFIINLLLLCSLLSKAQTIKVVSTNNQQALIGCLVYNDSLNIMQITNAKGEVETTSAFLNANSIFFSHIGYKGVVYSYKELERLHFIVQMEKESVVLKEVTIHSTEWENEKLESPNRITKLNMKEVAFQNPQTAADLLGTSGYVFIQKSQLGGGSPMLRGYATNRVLLVVDGVRMNTAVFRAGNLQNVISLDANALESTEILFGPGSVMYGSDAIGGIMNFKTLEPKFLDTSSSKKINVSGNALMRTSTANSEKTKHINFNVGFKKVALTTSFTQADYGDLRSGSVGGVNYFYRQNYVVTIDNKDYMITNKDSSLQIGSKYNQINFMQKLRFKPNRFWEFDYGFHISETSSYNRYDRLYVMQTDGPYKNKLRWAEWYYGPQKWNMQRIGITHLKSNFAYDQLRIIGAVQNFEESRYEREFMFRELSMQKENVKALSFNLDLNKTLIEKLNLNYGAELVHNTVNSFAELTHVVTKKVDSSVTRYPNGSTWESYGAYANLKYNITEKLIFNAGFRYNMYKIKAEFDTTYFPFPFTNTKMKNGNVVGSLGFVYTANKYLQLYINGANGFRAPNIDDMGKVFESTPGYLVVPNPKLKPESVYNAEIGAVTSISNFLKVDFAGYYTYLKDAMVRKDFTLNGQSTIRYLGNKSNIQAVQNVTEIKVQGIQAGVEFFYNKFGLRSNISYQDGKEQSPDSLIFYPLRHAAPTFGSTHLTYEHKKFKLNFYIVYNAKMNYEELALTERINASYARDEKGKAYAASWHTLNFKAAYYPNQHLAITVGIENIEDKLYRPYSSGINAPGRNLIASLRAKF